MLSADEMPDDNADLASIEIEFSRLREDTAASCPVPVDDLMGYLSVEVPDGQELQPEDLHFLRTADVQGTQYWIWSFDEPGGDPAHLTVAVSATGQPILGYEVNDYGLTPEQFILGDYHEVF